MLDAHPGKHPSPKPPALPLYNPFGVLQVGGNAGFAWEKRWWEEAYDSKLQKLQVSRHLWPLPSHTMMLLQQ